MTLGIITSIFQLRDSARSAKFFRSSKVVWNATVRRVCKVGAVKAGKIIMPWLLT